MGFCEPQGQEELRCLLTIRVPDIKISPSRLPMAKPVQTSLRVQSLGLLRPEPPKTMIKSQATNIWSLLAGSAAQPTTRHSDQVAVNTSDGSACQAKLSQIVSPSSPRRFLNWLRSVGESVASKVGTKLEGLRTQLLIILERSWTLKSSNFLERYSDLAAVNLSATHLPVLANSVNRARDFDMCSADSMIDSVDHRQALNCVF